MNTKLKIVISLVVAAVLVGIVAYYVARDRKYHYDVVFFFHSIPCSWIFADSTMRDIDTLLVTGTIRKTDQIYRYVYKHDYYILIWKINALRNVELQKVPVDQGVYLDNVELRGEILGAGSGLETEVRYGPFFKDAIAVDLDEYSKISDTFQGPNYRGFYGTVGKIAFDNGKGQILAMENYSRRIMPTLFVMYKAHDGFFIIIINSKKPFGVGMLKILNLK